MWALAALLLLAPSSGQAAALEKPTLSLQPPWTTIFKGERVTLRCDGHHPLVVELRPVSTLWYLGHLLLPSHGRSLEVQTPGVYRCQTRGAPVSDPVHLSVSNVRRPPDLSCVSAGDHGVRWEVPRATWGQGAFRRGQGLSFDPQDRWASTKLEKEAADWLILQVPYAAVFEGEPLVLRCRGWYDKVVYKLHYYRDGQAVRYFHSSTNYTVPQARASDSGRYQCSGTMRIPVESAPMFSSKVAVTVQELFPAPVLKVAGQAEAGGVVVRCETRPHPRRSAVPLQFAFYKHSRAVRRFDWGAEYRVPESELDELESHWCEAATASRSVRKRSAWLQLPGRGPSRDASTAAPGPQAAPLAPGNKPLSFRKPLVSTSVPSVISVPNTTSAGRLDPGGRGPSAAPAGCEPPKPAEQSARALRADVDLLLREMRLLKGLLSRVVRDMRDPQAFSELGAALQTPTARWAGTQGALETHTVGS